MGWHTLAYSGILWHTLAYSGILWHTLGLLLADDLQIYLSAIKVSISVSRASLVGGAAFFAPLPLAVPLPLPLEVALPLPLPAPTLALNPLTPPAAVCAAHR